MGFVVGFSPRLSVWPLQFKAHFNAQQMMGTIYPSFHVCISPKPTLQCNLNKPRARRKGVEVTGGRVLDQARAVKGKDKKTLGDTERKYCQVIVPSACLRLHCSDDRGRGWMCLGKERRTESSVSAGEPGSLQWS